jgi:multidrug efflux system membrane fusion protein
LLANNAACQHSHSDPDMKSTIHATPPHSHHGHEQPHHGHAKGRLLRALIWAALLLIFGYAFYLVLWRKDDPKGRTASRRGGSGPIPITTVVAQKGDIGVYLDAIGTVTPVYTASIFSQVTGVVILVNYKEGQFINKGDPLVNIDARLYEAMLMQAQGTLEKDEHVLEQARMDLDRYRGAWARNAVSKQILDDQEKLVRQNEGAVKNDQGVVQYDKLQTEYCHITAPISGQVGLRLVDPGNLVTAGTNANANPLAVITQMQPITVIFTISEDHLGAVQAQLRKNSKLAVEVFDRSAQTKIASGEVSALDNQVDTTTGTVKVRATFSNEDLALFPNQFVNVRLLLETKTNAILIPSAAVQQNGQASFVYVIENETAHLREVKPGVTENGLTQVEGIASGDMVANSSFEKLQDSDKISIASGNSSVGYKQRDGKGK